jgi:hypothetical protein
MTITLELTAEEEAQLKAKAERAGLGGSILRADGTKHLKIQAPERLGCTPLSEA